MGFLDQINGKDTPTSFTGITGAKTPSESSSTPVTTSDA
jgi:hypothetical protein